MKMTDTAGRDRLYYQQQRALLATVHNAWAAATAASDDLRSRLEELDELAEAIAFEVTDAGVQHRYSGQPVPWMQQRIGEHVKAVSTAAERLRFAADDLHESANDAGGMSRLAHVAIGHRALVAEAVRVVASHRPDANWNRWTGSASMAWSRALSAWRSATRRSCARNWKPIWLTTTNCWPTCARPASAS